MIVDRRMRAATSAAVAAMADRLTKAAAHEVTALELELSARECGMLIPESRAVGEFVKSSRDQLPAAIKMVVGALQGHARGVLSGHYPPSLPRPAAAPPVLTVVPVPPAPMMNIFAMKNLKYIGNAGAVVCIGGKKRHDVPQALGELAISSGVALPISAPRCRDIGYNASPFDPDERNCTWLGEPDRELPPRSMKPGPAAIHSSLTTFEVMNRGPAYPATFTRPPEPEPMPEPLAAGGARKLDEE